ncbi:MAG: GlxA family transcriptional regulator [Marinibacterium sp.]|nr:GlxA family transcriptional regulator [Marinibacterium sp.]
MPVWSKSNAATQQIGVLLFDGFSNHCLANLLEPLRAANRFLGRDSYHWQILSLNGDPITSSSGLTLQADAALADAGGDLLALIPSYDYERHLAGPALRMAARRFAVMAGLDTGAWLMAAAGLLDGHRATIHWDEFDRFAERFPEIDAQRARFVIDGRRITCSGAMTAFDLVLHLLADAHGQALALDVAQLFVSPGQDQVASRSAPVTRALALMRGNLEHPLSIAEIARRAGRPQKWLEQRMQRDLGAAPRRVYQRLRLAHARKLVTETELPVSEIALRSGYGDASSFTRAFRREFGAAPRALRAGLSGA